MTDANSPATQADPVLAQAQQLLDAQQFGAVVSLMNEALLQQPTNPDYIGALAKGLMPGPGYKRWLHRLHREIRPDSYVEIGVSKGMTLAMATPQTRCVGIDPAFRIEAEIPALARLYPCTSDAFFSRYDLLEELGCARLDLAFIDGLHLFEQVLRDFINIERYANSDTTVLIHDCYPVSELTASRERKTDFWSGDVWRIIPCLMRERPDLAINVIPCKPCGLAVVTGLNPENRTLDEGFEDISRRFAGLQYGEFARNRPAVFPLVENNWAAIKPLFPAR